ncbi:MAG: YfcE family phosphodiesterase [Spirochaetes bacterium]|nr:YfcE family phosphodiesterase [Spirochaetota bacterium]
MKRIVVVSDSHGNTPRLSGILARESPFDVLVHCGDGTGDLFHVEIPSGVTVVAVSGNIDVARGSDRERMGFFEADDTRFLVVHGDQYRVHHDYSWIEREGRARNVDVVLFGHTHSKFHGPGRPILFNPGPASGGYYGYITTGKRLHFEHRRLTE